MPVHDRSYAILHARLIALRRARLIAAIIGLFIMTVRVEEAYGADESLLLEVIVNNYPTGKIGQFVRRDGALYAKPEELRELGFRVSDSVALTKDNLVGLADLPGFTARLDTATQTLHVRAGAERMLPALLEVAGSAPQGKAAVESGIGAMFNYDVVGTLVGNQTIGSGLFDLRAFSPWGVLSNGLLAYAGTSPIGSGGYSAVRLDSTYVYSDPETLRRYWLGDFITGGLPWTRPVRLGGAQVTSNFVMRPDLITFPLPSVSGTVAVPSTVDVLVNGARILSREVQPGPFQVPQLPVITGASTVSMAVTNALGQQVTTTLPFYASSLLLAPGLQTYSVEAGLVRRNWGVLSNDYGTVAGAATYRRGLSDWLTVEGHAEGASGLAMAGLGLVINVADLAVVNVAAAASTRSGQTGAQLSAGIQHIGPRFTLAASATVASSGFADIATVNGDPVSRLQLNAGAGLALGRFGSVGVAYNGLESPATVVQGVAPWTPGGLFLPAQRTHLFSASYSVQVLRNASLYATAYRDVGNSGSSGVLVGLTVPLGSRSSASASVSSTSQDRSVQVQAMQTPVTIDEWGYRLFGSASAANQSHAFAELQYRSQWALVSAGADRTGGQTTFQAGARGALSFAGGGLFASNRINDSFAVVDTNGVKDVSVAQENRYAGRTNSSGQLLVPDLRSFDVNHISIEPTDVPVDATVPYTTRNVRPQDRSGVVVSFPIRTSRGALLRVTDEAGAPMPVGSIATLKSTGATAPVGYDGEVYLVDLQPRNEVTVERRDGRRCAVSFDYQAKPGEIPAIGPLRCREQTQ